MNDLIVRPQPEVWVHYTSSPDQIIPRTFIQQSRRDADFKPRGLWITPQYRDDNWLQWSLDNKFRLAELNYCHEVTLNPKSNILRISSAEELDAFSDEYAMSTLRDAPHQSWMSADWVRLSQSYGGILITPYIYERRLFRGSKCDWYYAWDCSSGCIWDEKAIQEIKLISDVSAGYENDPEQEPERLRERLKEATASLLKNLSDQEDAA